MMLGRDRKEQDQIAIGSLEAHADGDGTLLAPFTSIGLPCLQVWIANDSRCLDQVIAQYRLPSSS